MLQKLLPPVFARVHARPLLEALFGVILVTNSAAAASVSINDTNPDGTVVITWEGFISFSVNGGAAASSGSVTIAPASALSFSGSWLANPPGTATTSGNTLDILDPGTNHIREQLLVSSSMTPGSPF